MHPPLPGRSHIVPALTELVEGRYDVLRPSGGAVRAVVVDGGRVTTLDLSG